MGPKVQENKDMSTRSKLLDWVIVRGDHGTLVARAVRLSASHAAVMSVTVC